MTKIGAVCIVVVGDNVGWKLSPEENIRIEDFHYNSGVAFFVWEWIISYWQRFLKTEISLMKHYMHRIRAGLISSLWNEIPDCSGRGNRRSEIYIERWITGGLAEILFFNNLAFWNSFWERFYNFDKNFSH